MGVRTARPHHLALIEAHKRTEIGLFFLGRRSVYDSTIKQIEYLPQPLPGEHHPSYGCRWSLSSPTYQSYRESVGMLGGREEQNLDAPEEPGFD